MSAWLLIPLALVFGVGWFLGRRERVHRRVRCPESGADADIDVVQPYGRSDRPEKVDACSALADPKKVDCDQACLDDAAE